MSPKTAIPILIALALIFIAVGDKFLPQPLARTSLRTRTAINQYMVSSFKVWQPKARPNERTERAIDREEKGQNP